MSWLVQYRARTGDVMTTQHDTREAARDALVDQLLESALTLWAIGSTYPKSAKARQGFLDRGDRFIHHAARLMETTEDAYVIAGAGNRKWILCST